MTRRIATPEEVAALVAALRVEVVARPAETESAGVSGSAAKAKDPVEALARLLASAWLRAQRRGKVPSR